jgi:hypothetical protein
MDALSIATGVPGFEAFEINDLAMSHVELTLTISMSF